MSSMNYQYTCPLCLTKLGPGQALMAFKIPDVSVARKKPLQGKRFDCGRKSYIADIFKYGGDAALVADGERAVYISHELCEAPNPFWDKSKGKVQFPVDSGDGRILVADLKCYLTGEPLKKELSHWIVAMLRDARELGDDYEPMWFTFPLLLATATNGQRDLTRPYGSLVEMASTKDVGKTILTLQLLNQALYRNGRSIEIADYFYPNVDHQDEERKIFRDKFYKELYYYCMWRSTPSARPFGTEPSPGDLRAVFLKPVEAEEGEELVAAPPAPEGRLRRLVRVPYKWAVLFARDFLSSGKKKKKVEEPVALDALLAQSRDKFWNPILFYDTAGELQKKMSPLTRSVRQITNKLAICIDVREVFDWKGARPEEVPRLDKWNASINHARMRLAEMDRASILRKPTCILVTKLDLIPLDEDDRLEAERLAEEAEDSDGARDLLIKWLKAHADDDKRALLDLLPARRKLVDRVFFVWTKNLPEMRGARFSPIYEFTPQEGKVGDTVTITAQKGFNFNDAQRITFNGVESKFVIRSKDLIEAEVPAGASSGFIGVVLKGLKKPEDDPGAQSTEYVDNATSETVFVVHPEKGIDVGKPRSHGLIKFLAWCLDKKVPDISLPTG